MGKSKDKDIEAGNNNTSNSENNSNDSNNTPVCSDSEKLAWGLVCAFIIFSGVGGGLTYGERGNQAFIAFMVLMLSGFVTLSYLFLTKLFPDYSVSGLCSSRLFSSRPSSPLAVQETKPLTTEQDSAKNHNLSIEGNSSNTTSSTTTKVVENPDALKTAELNV